MIEDHQLKTFRESVATAFSAGTQYFPHYTLHGKEHLDELDRLCLLFCSLIPKLSKDKESTNILRLAIILHDYAMVDVPSEAREAELRKEMGAALSFSDIVRMTHQDEMVKSLEKGAESLHTVFSSADLQDINAAITVARYHRFHPLDGAEEHLKGLCALMRLLDELEIGPKRAPRSTYSSLRGRMDEISRFHWLKHICCAKVEKDKTLFLEKDGDCSVLKIWVATLATADSWRILQGEVLGKLKHCLDEEGVKEIIRDKFNVKIEIGAMEEKASLCGTAQVLPPEIRDDLEALALSHAPATTAKEDAPPAPSKQNTKADGASVMASVPVLSDRQLTMYAIPPENLFDHLSRASRLSVIGNDFVGREEVHAGGKSGAPNRVYLGPADCGKTRSAAEWIHEITHHHPSNWVILRSELGSVPRDVDTNIILDRSLYDGHGLPQNAILFLDDLPGNLPPTGSEQDASEAIRRLLFWFNALPYFHERRFVGTIRLEDLHARIGWPEALPTLGTDLELLRLVELKEGEFLELWRGMHQGTVFVSRTMGPQNFSLDLSDDFATAVAKRSTNVEGVAQFVFESVRHNPNGKLESNDATSFHDSAVQTWLTETWPALRENYGVPARVFHTLARFLEGGLRSRSILDTSLSPDWDYHAAFGPDLCAVEGDNGDTYLEVILQMVSDGHAVGSQGDWIRPRWDHLLQADALPDVEVDLPDGDWFAQRAGRLSPLRRSILAIRLVAAEWELEDDTQDPGWLAGMGLGKIILAERSTEPETQKGLRKEAVKLIGRSTSFLSDTEDLTIKAVSAMALINKGVTLRALERPDEAIAVYDEVVTRFGDAEEVTLKEWVAKALVNKGVTLRALERPDEAIAVCDEVVTRFGDAEEVTLKEWVAKALVNKGVTLGMLERPGEEIAVYDEVVARFGDAEELALQEGVANALFNKGVTLATLEKPDDAIAVYDEVVTRFGDAEEVTLKKGVAVALVNKGVTLRALGRPDEAIAVYDEVVTRFGDAEGPALQEQVSKALVNKGGTLGTLERPVDAIAVYDEVVARFGDAEEVTLQEPVAKALVNKGVTLRALERPDEAIAVYDEVVARFGDAEELALQQPVAKTFLYKGVTLGTLEKPDEEIAVYDEVVARFGDAEELALQEAVAMVLRNRSTVLVSKWRELGDRAFLDSALESARQGVAKGDGRYNLACVLAVMGEADEAFDELVRSLDGEEISWSHIDGAPESEIEPDPDWDELRDHPRYVALKEQWG